MIFEHGLVSRNQVPIDRAIDPEVSLRIVRRPLRIDIASDGPVANGRLVRRRNRKLWRRSLQDMQIRFPNDASLLSSVSDVGDWLPPGREI